MSIKLADPSELIFDPIETVEKVFSANELPHERMGAEDLSAEFSGTWSAYQMWFAYRPDLAALHFACGFDMRVPEARRRDIYPLLTLINERLWIGHFDLWTDEGQPTWRHALLLRGQGGPAEAQIEDLISLGVSECERFYPAFQHVLWAGQPPEDALTAALIETVGQA